MNNYELTYLLKPEMTKKEISTLSEKINSFIQSQKGVIEKNLPEQTKTLGYPIQNSKNVFLKTVVFSYNPKVLLLLDKYLKEEKSIVRFLIIKIEVKKVKIRKRYIDKIDALAQKQEIEKKIEEKAEKIIKEVDEKEEIEIAEKIQSFTQDSKQKEEKVELKDIDKKLEEILEE